MASQTRIPYKNRVRPITFRSADNKEIEIEVSHFARKERCPKREGDLDYWFELSNDEYNLHLKGTDLEALRDEAFNILQVKTGDIQWLKYYLVIVEHRNSSGNMGRQNYMSGMFSLKYEEYELGEYENGVKVRKDPHCDRTHLGWPEVGVEIPVNKYNSGDERVMTKSLVLATSETKAKLDDTIDRIGHLAKYIQDIMGPDTIENTLRNFTGLQLPEGH